jgi:hypothetical protein
MASSKSEINFNFLHETEAMYIIKNTLYWKHAEFDDKRSGSYSGHYAFSKFHTGSCNHWPLKW